MTAPGVPNRGMANSDLRVPVALSAIAFSALYVVSDVIELAAGGLTTGQLIVTYVAEASIPFYVLGLNSLQQPRGGWPSLVGALMYAVAFVGFSATVLYPLVTGTRDADTVFNDFGVIYSIHAGLAFAGGLLFGASVLRARVFPRWTGFALIAGLLVTGLLAGLGLPEGVQTVGTAVRSVAFAGMGAAVLFMGRDRLRLVRRAGERGAGETLSTVSPTVSRPAPIRGASAHLKESKSRVGVRRKVGGQNS
jgi:hypothetical protein